MPSKLLKSNCLDDYSFNLRLSVIILTCNQRDFTVRCLKSIYPLCDNPDYEIIIVDNASQDNTKKEILTNFPKVKYIYLTRNVGVAAGRNTGLNNSSGQYLMFLDNDTVASPETIIGMTDYLEINPDIGLIAPKLISPQGETQLSFKSFPGILKKIRNVILPHSRCPYNVVLCEPFYVIGACQLFSRNTLIATGILDDNIFYGPEDADFCIRIRKTGKRIVYNPDFVITHDWQRRTTRRPFSYIGRKHIAGLLYFYRKHRRIL